MRQASPPDLFSRTRAALTLLALAATPLLISTANYDSFSPLKTAWVETMALLLATLAFCGALWGRRARFDTQGVSIPIILFVLWNFAMWPLAESRSLAGERATWILAVAVVAWNWRECADGRRRQILIAFWALAAAAALTAGWALLQDIGLLAAGVNRLGDWRGNISAGLGSTDFIGAFLATLYLPLLFLAMHVRGRFRVAFLLATLWLAAAALIVCWSVGANGSLIIAAAIVAFGLGKQRLARLWKKRRQRITVWIAGCCCVIFWLSTDTSLNPHGAPEGVTRKYPGIFGEAFSSERWIAGGPTRGVIWINTLEMIRRNQIKGVGPGNFTYVYPTIRSELMPKDPRWQAYQGAYTNAAHQSILQTWAELGPVGAFLLILMAVAAFRSLVRVSCRSGLDAWIAWGGIGALAVLCLDSFMTFPLQIKSLTVLFFILLPLGEMLGDRHAARESFQMPPLILEGRFGELVLRLRGMKRVLAVSGSFLLPRRASIILTLCCVLICGVGVWRIWRPVASDIVYRQAKEIRNTNATEATSLYRRALQINPRHHDCRSAFSLFLLDTDRYAECVEQMAIIFERLNSTELYERRGNAYRALGKNAEAARDDAIFRERTRIEIDPARRGGR